jgi:glycerol-3-phosphate dehydrogenase
LVKQKGAKNTALISRDHTIIVSKANLVTITGGKWTTYRKMAEDVVNNAAFAAKLPKKACVTKQLPIGDTQKATSKNGETFLREAFTYTAADIIHFANMRWPILLKMFYQEEQDVVA